MIVEEEMDRKVMTKGGKGKCFDCSIKFGCLLSDDPRRTEEKTAAHV